MAPVPWPQPFEIPRRPGAVGLVDREALARPHDLVHVVLRGDVDAAVDVRREAVADPAVAGPGRLLLRALAVAHAHHAHRAEVAADRDDVAVLGRDHEPAVEGHVHADEQARHLGREPHLAPLLDRGRRVARVGVAPCGDRAALVADVVEAVAVEERVDAREVAELARLAEGVPERREPVRAGVEGGDRGVGLGLGVGTHAGEREGREHGEALVVDLRDAVEAVAPVHAPARRGRGPRSRRRSARGRPARRRSRRGRARAPGRAAPPAARSPAARSFRARAGSSSRRARGCGAGARRRPRAGAPRARAAGRAPGRAARRATAGAASRQRSAAHPPDPVLPAARSGASRHAAAGRRESPRRSSCVCGARSLPSPVMQTNATISAPTRVGNPRDVVGARLGPVRPHVIVLFGATGDLSRRKLLPGLFHLFRAGLLPECRIVGTSLDDLDDDGFRAFARAALDEFARHGVTDERLGRASRARCATCPQSAGPDGAGRRGRGAPKHELGGDVAAAALPERAARGRAAPSSRMLGEAGLAERARIIMEKPFGTDLASAARAQRRPARGLRRGADLPHRPLPRQGGGAEHPRLPLRERAVRADLEPPAHRRTCRSTCPRRSAIGQRAPASTRRPARTATWS